MRTKIKKLLVCNRGEIAIRIFRACNELGIETVAVYTHEDRFSLHRYKADEAYQIGRPGAPVASYLNISEVAALAKSAGVDAVHPGYGFLSERLELRERLEEEGIIFVGPSSETLRIAGDKVATRELAEKEGVPLIKGSPALADAEAAKEFAKKCGFPIIIKASYGGGGRGMRVVKSEAELAAAFDAARDEAESSFGRDEVFIEKYVSRPKHVEVQLLGDGLGRVIHLYERDCSVQRRHQKVVEFAPSIALKEDTRAALLAYAVKLGCALNLESAATAEFLIDESDNIFFIEINPRIQVEHTVTEEVTGVDLVQSQIEIAGRPDS